MGFLVLFAHSQLMERECLVYSRGSQSVVRVPLVERGGFSSGRRDIFQKRKKNLFSRNPHKNFFTL